MKKLTIVVPCYNEEKALPYFVEEMSIQAKNIQYNIEYLFVNDGSKDKTLTVLLDLKKKYDHLNFNIINFSRNFGKEAGMLAGLKNSTGDLVVMMDADMQDPPSLLPKMIEIIENNDVDSVATYRVTRKGEPPIRSFFARKFYAIINKISEIDIVDGSRDYRLMTRRMVDAILDMSEYHRFSKGIFVWVGFSTQYLEYENVERVAGETKWSFWKLLMYAIEGIVAFTTVPLRLSTLVGLFMSMVTLAYMVFVFIKALLYGDPVAGYPSMMVVILFLGGAQLLSLGVLGEYLSKTYMEVKKRPHYIIKDRF
ncbi:MAG TPA: glycosyltransferase family 2 protein [Erysipelotrichaceae bacterium]|nr:glycosyltransferase family 2 protein [Erysipelotrichaceae bacterium]